MRFSGREEVQYALRASAMAKSRPKFPNRSAFGKRSSATLTPTALGTYHRSVYDDPLSADGTHQAQSPLRRRLSLLSQRDGDLIRGYCSGREWECPTTPRRNSGTYRLWELTGYVRCDRGRRPRCEQAAERMTQARPGVRTFASRRSEIQELGSFSHVPRSVC